MKSLIAVAIFCLMAVGTVQAQKVESKPAQKVEQSTEIDALAKQLGLTVEQKANVGKTMTAFGQTIDRIKASSLSEADKATKLAAITSRMEGNLKTYLSEDQYAKYEKIKSAKKSL